MKKSKYLIAGLSMSLILTACSNGAGNSNDAKNKLTVNGSAVTQAKYKQQYDLIANVMAYNNQLPSTIREFFVRYEIAKKDLTDNKIEIKDEDYKAEIDKAIQSLGGEDKYDEYLSEMNTSKEAFEENIKMNLLMNKHKEWYVKNNQPKEEDIKKYYTTNKANLSGIDVSHILVKDEAKANEVYKKLQDGEKFEDLSDQYSTDTAAKANKGSLGLITDQAAAQYDETFMKEAKKVKEGEYSKPFKTNFGWHIVKINKLVDSAEKAKDQIVLVLGEQNYESYLQGKSSEAKVEDFDNSGNKIENKQEDSANTQQVDDQK